MIPAGVDAAARDVVRLGHDRCLQVRAGAGTGKTRELVGRIVELVAAGTAEIGELAVITFTEKAAAELRDRVRSALETRAASGPEPERARAATALGDLDTATICTLHAFARRILTEHPYATGVTPGFEVLDAVSEQTERAAWWRETLARMHEDPGLERPLVTLAAGAAVRAGMIEDVARALEDRQEHLATVAQQAPPAVPPLEDGPLLREVREVCARRRSCADPRDALAAHLERLERWVDECSAGDEATRLRLLATRAVTSRGNAGRKGAWPDGLKQQIIERLAAAEAGRTAALDRVLVPAAQAVVVWLARAVLDAAADRVARGRLTFHDLLVVAATALRADGELRARCAERWRYVLIDEFQDTDPLQLELAVRIAAADPAAAGGAWPGVPLRPGALFVVGDPQQSIYRFRRADIAVYAAARRHLPADELHLQRNHRSRPGILHWVNTVFGALLSPGGDPSPPGDAEPAAGAVQVAHQPLQAAVEPDPAVPIPVRVLGGPLGAERVPAAEVRAQTAEDLAALARRIVAEGWPVRTDEHDPGARPGAAGDPVRPARFGDVAVLLPSRLMLRPLETAFERAGLSLRVECQSLLWATREVDELTQVLRALADPADRLAIVAALRTPAFGCSDRDLAGYRLAGGRWSLWADPPDELGADHPVARALARLRDLHRRVAPQPVDEGVEAVVDALRLPQLAACTPRPRDAWRRLRHVTATARSFAADAGVTLRDFVAWIDLQADAGARVDEAVVAEPDDDAVRVFTIHGAKGLEFPIVALAGLGGARRTEQPRALVSATGVEVQLGYAERNPGRRHRVRTAGYTRAADAERDALAAEEVRLWYVAATRARDHLVVACHHHPAPPGAKHPSFAARLWQLAHEVELPWAPIEPSPDPAGVGPGAAAAGPPARPAEAGVAERDAWWADRQARIAPQAARPVCSATALGAAGAPTPAPAAGGPDPDDPERPPWRRGRAATARGRAVHAVLQSIDLATGEGLRAAAYAQAEAEAIPAEAERIAALADSARTAPTVQALIADRCWREVPLAVTVEGVLVEGYVDLLAEASDGSLVVVDFKTDAGVGRTVPAERLAPYRRQLAAYALALEALTRRTVSRAVLVFAREGAAAVEHEVDDLPAAIAEVRTLLADRFAAAGAAGVGPAGLEPATHGL